VASITTQPAVVTALPADYLAAYRQSIDDPAAFWGTAAEAIEWTTTPPRVVGGDAQRPTWFKGGALNTCHNAVDRHVAAGRGGRPAIIYDSPVTATKRTVTYEELMALVSTFAAGLARLGVGAGDRVVIYMPMVPETIVAMLACARLGAVHSVVFGGFAAPELAARIDDARPKVVIAASCGIEPGRIVEYKPLLDAALKRARHRPHSCIVLQRAEAEACLGEGDLSWEQAVAGGGSSECVAVASEHPLYILYTSGTTGPPKGVVRDNGGHATALLWSFSNVYGMTPEDVWWAASDLGWVVGHSYIVYAPLLAGATTVLYEGKPIGTPDASAFWRVAAEHRVAGLFTAPTAIRAIKREDPEGDGIRSHDLDTLRTLFLAGERLDPATFEWSSRRLGIPVVDNWWQTETGWPIAAGLRGLGEIPLKSGSPSVPVPGYEIRVLGVDAAPLPAGEQGAIALRLPLPPGSLTTLWEDDGRYLSDYLEELPGYYSTGDGGYVDEDGYLFVMGRTDDVINVAGHRLSTGSMEAVLAAHDAVAECAVIGVPDELKGEVPRGLVVLKQTAGADPAEICSQLVGAVRAEIGPVAALRRVDVVDALPKTRSGKVMRRAMRSLASGSATPPPPTIEDPAVLTRLEPILRPGD
jgi:propionyl-CoA synthetase